MADMKTVARLLASSAIAVAITFAAGYSTQSLDAAAAVAYSERAYGYAFNVETIEEAEELARKMCEENGGIDITIIASTDQRGYGAIAADGNIVGAVVGYPDLRSASNRALTECIRKGCENPRIIATWFDRAY